MVFNANFVVDFRPETWAMPLLALAIWANRAERRWFWLLCLFVMMGFRDGIGLICIGLALEQAYRRRWRWAGEALLLASTGGLTRIAGLVEAHDRICGQVLQLETLVEQGVNFSTVTKSLKRPDGKWPKPSCSEIMAGIYNAGAVRWLGQSLRIGHNHLHP